jgi:hypothetical protein
MDRSTRVTRIMAACIVLASATALPTAGAAEAPSGEAQWLRALAVRSQALNELYGLGDHASDAEWLRGLEVRGRALNGHYGVS